MRKTLLMTLLMGIVLYANSSCEQQKAPVVEIVNDFEKFDQLKDQGTVLVDVRTIKEFENGYIDGALHFDISSSDFKEKLATLDKSKPVMVYCAVGGRSGRASSMMKNMGFEKVYDFSPGIRGWKQKGRPLVK